MKIKIYDGTQPDAHLCRSCIASAIRIENSREVTVCRELPASANVIRGRVTKCSLYQSTAAYTVMRDFQANAWHLDRDEDGNLAWNTPADREGPYRSRRLHHRRNPSRTAANPDPTVQ